MIGEVLVADDLARAHDVPVAVVVMVRIRRRMCFSG
jgi:hypothetical protein